MPLVSIFLLPSSKNKQLNNIYKGWTQVDSGMGTNWFIWVWVRKKMGGLKGRFFLECDVGEVGEGLKKTNMTHDCVRLRQSKMNTRNTTEKEFNPYPYFSFFNQVFNVLLKTVLKKALFRWKLQHVILYYSIECHELQRRWMHPIWTNDDYTQHFLMHVIVEWTIYH